MKIKKTAVKTKKSGRPKLRENKKSSRVNVSMTEDQRVIVEEKAAVAILSASAFLLK